MHSRLLTWMAVRLSAGLFIFHIAGIAQEIELIREVKVSGSTRDLSGIERTLSDGTPGNLLGGPSGLTWTGQGHNYFWISDRGPKDGATDHVPRFHEFDFSQCVMEGAQPIFRRTVLLKNDRGVPLSGSAAAIDQQKVENSLRFDSEAIAIRNGKIIVSDEYGPVVREFDESGTALKDWPVPSRFLVTNPSGDPDREFADNAVGRLPNAGFEGMCVDGQNGLLAAVQRPLRQDGAYSSSGERVGRHIRLLSMCGPDCKPREFVYVLDQPTLGISEICHVGGTLFLAIERDGNPGEAAVSKLITLFDIADATDVSNVPRLPETELPASIVPVRKKVLIDLIDPRFGLSGSKFPEKIEGLTFGPNLPDGRRLLVVGTDNDFETDEPIQLWFFAVDSSRLKVD